MEIIDIIQKHKLTFTNFGDYIIPTESLRKLSFFETIGIRMIIIAIAPIIFTIIFLKPLLSGNFSEIPVNDIQAGIVASCLPMLIGIIMSFLVFHKSIRIFKNGDVQIVNLEKKQKVMKELSIDNCRFEYKYSAGGPKTGSYSSLVVYPNCKLNGMFFMDIPSAYKDQGNEICVEICSEILKYVNSQPYDKRVIVDNENRVLYHTHER